MGDAHACCLAAKSMTEQGSGPAVVVKTPHLTDTQEQTLVQTWGTLASPLLLPHRRRAGGDVFLLHALGVELRRTLQNHVERRVEGREFLHEAQGVDAGHYERT